MPPKRKSTSTSTGPASRRSRRTATVHSTMASSTTTAVPGPSVPSLDPQLLQTIISTVSDEVTRRIEARLPIPRDQTASCWLPTASPPAPSPVDVENTDASQPSTNLVNEAIAGASCRYCR